MKRERIRRYYEEGEDKGIDKEVVVVKTMAEMCHLLPQQYNHSQELLLAVYI